MDRTIARTVKNGRARVLEARDGRR